MSAALLSNSGLSLHRASRSGVGAMSEPSEVADVGMDASASVGGGDDTCGESDVSGVVGASSSVASATPTAKKNTAPKRAAKSGQPGQPPTCAICGDD